MSNNQLKKFLVQCVKFEQSLQDHRSELIELLTTYETYETAIDEIDRTLETLEGVKVELESISKPLSNLVISTFFPLNLPLYSLMLFGIMPSAFSKHIFIRPPEIMAETLGKIVDLLQVDKLFPKISYYKLPRHIFMELYAKDSDAIIFTGKYENAINIHKQCPNALLLYNGSGVNPFVLFKDADVELAVNKAVEMRCFNSGQDCAGPDAFFVPMSLAKEFIYKLEEKLDGVKVGHSKDPNVKVSKTMKPAYIDEIEKWLTGKEDGLIYGGKIDKQRQLVYPTIVQRDINDKEEFHEFFAPIFYILTYSSDQELLKALRLTPFKARAMYVSVFGKNKTIEDHLDFVTLLKNKIVNDTERGNEEYGGYGENANFLLYRDRLLVQPVLISRDLHHMLA